MKNLILLTIFLYVLVCAHGKLKRKYESDFTFAEEDNKIDTEGKTLAPMKRVWIHDPENDLCGPLNCKKKELCLLENLYTAVCVGKKELHKNGDIIMSKTKYLSDEAIKKAVNNLNAKIDEEMNDNEDDDDEDDYDTDDDIFYDTDVKTPKKDNINAYDSPTPKCNVCPVITPIFLCGSDNQTYSSLCRLDYHNCIHRTEITVACRGFCPCKVEAPVEQTTYQSVTFMEKQKVVGNDFTSNKGKLDTNLMKMDSKRKSALDKYNLIPEDFRYDNKLYKYIKYTKNSDLIPHESVFFATKEPVFSDADDGLVNGINDEKPITLSEWRRKKPCSDTMLKNMGNRLLDWFSVIMSNDKRKSAYYKAKGHKYTGCKQEVGWMFQHLDTNKDSQLSLQELYDMEHDESEHCMRPFLDLCDTDRDIFISHQEWCRCFTKSERPCAAIKRRVPVNIQGVYVPMCDTEGFYKPMQCHLITGMCWCVDKHGVEQPNSRTRGKLNCDSLMKGESPKLWVVPKLDGVDEVKKSTTTTVGYDNEIHNIYDSSNDDTNDDDDGFGDDDASDDTEEGSADKPLDF